MSSFFRAFVKVIVIAAALTYCSLLVPGQVLAVCGDLGKPIDCQVLAYGFPLPFLADNPGMSPVGSVGRDPLSLIDPIDDVLWPELLVAILFWASVTKIVGWQWLYWRRRRPRR